MQDNGFDFIPSPAQRRYLDAMRGQNIAANGRWGMLAMGAIALHQGAAIFAFLFVLTLLIAYLVEQLAPKWHAMAAFALGAWGLVLVWGLFVVLLWR